MQFDTLDLSINPSQCVCNEEMSGGEMLYSQSRFLSGPSSFTGEKSNYYTIPIQCQA